MRLTTPLKSAHPWLQSLKSAQLQRIAQATGIQSAGPKGTLMQRLDTELRDCAYKSGDASSQPLSILSIDMGIRNLAFAHLLVPSPPSSPQGVSKAQPQAPARVSPTLTAWRRLSLSEPGAGDFSPGTYAPVAYALVTGLLATYRPTHVLIERQRFRSGGGSAVQEWTLRVGVFEGMVYAVFYALRERQLELARGAQAEAMPVVLGVEPQRVLRYWEGAGSERGGAKRVSSREGKKIKIDLVGRWVSSAMESGVKEEGEEEEEEEGEAATKVRVGEDAEVRQWVDGYLDRWSGKRVRRGESADGKPDIGKLDDLADCLLQGVTWLEWQVMRDRIVREGVGALSDVL
ncbi:mitochondrial resolvase Ydc2 [Aspergillus floccosus]